HPQQFDTSESGRTCHFRQTLHVRSPPIVVLPSELIEFIKFHDWISRVIEIVDHMRLDDGKIPRHFTDLFEGQQRMSQVIEHAEEKDKVKGAEPLLCHLINAEFVKFGHGAERGASFEKIFRTPAIDRRDARATPLGFEAVKSVPATDVEHPRAAQILRQFEMREVVAKFFDRMDALCNNATAKIDAVPPRSSSHFGI